MKMILLAASVLALGGIAQAQDATQPPPAAPTDSSTMAPPAAPATPADAAAPAMAPTDPAAAAAPAAATDDSNLPVCSKSVTDKCKQGGTGHHMKHKKK